MINYHKPGKAFDLAIPTPEHFLHLLCAAGLNEENEIQEIFNDKPVMETLMMTSVKIDRNK